ncbi:hypothetical protein BKA93DRAFT_753989 [Sparassis latifolia]|uniref:Uncharacterized protein n=1 Tax=Sparassis crispa TaxID=139825 RepID=A0A401GZ23_9APHY|nr:hypothetical protein SCP_1100760 [Sparassis crispa]GBE87400.1 hypothetical protein SCP_1100760 [Sparassis crispa]
MTRRRREKDFLDVFPNELLLMIKARIAETDLRTHVCFYNSSTRIAGMYGNVWEQEEYWKKLCWLNGLGLLPGESCKSVSWKQIAFECVEDDGFCDLPDCGGNALVKNVALMAAADYNLERPTQALAHKEGGPDLDCSPLLSHIKFRSNQEWSWRMKPDYDAQLYVRPSEAQSSWGRRLHAHPIACRSFATFPPIQRLNFSELYGLEFHPTKRTTGVTVWDVQSTLQKKLDTGILASGVAEFLEWHETNVPKHWDVRTMLNELCTLRGMLSVVRWDGMEISIDDDDDGPYFVIELVRIERDDDDDESDDEYSDISC